MRIKIRICHTGRYLAPAYGIPMQRLQRHWNDAERLAVDIGRTRTLSRYLVTIRNAQADSQTVGQAAIKLAHLADETSNALRYAMGGR